MIENLKDTEATLEEANNAMKIYQKQLQEEYYQYIKDVIIEHCQKVIKNNPNKNSITIDEHYRFLAYKRFNSNNILPEPKWIFYDIKKYQDRLEKDLKLQGINLLKVANYKRETKGFFRKKEYKIKTGEYYILSWE